MHFSFRLNEYVTNQICVSAITARTIQISVIRVVVYMIIKTLTRAVQGQIHGVDSAQSSGIYTYRMPYGAGCGIAYRPPGGATVVLGTIPCGCLPLQFSPARTYSRTHVTYFAPLARVQLDELFRPPLRVHLP